MKKKTRQFALAGLFLHGLRIDRLNIGWFLFTDGRAAENRGSTGLIKVAHRL